MVEASWAWRSFSPRPLEVIKVSPKAGAAVARHRGRQLIGQSGLAGRRESVHANTNRMWTFDPSDHPGQTVDNRRAPPRIGAGRRTPLIHAPEPSQTPTGRTLSDAALAVSRCAGARSPPWTGRARPRRSTGPGSTGR